MVILRYLRMHQKQSERVQNTKIFWGGMPQTPLDVVCLRTRIFTPLPPLTLIKPYFFPPLSHFLDEGLTSWQIEIDDQRQHVYVLAGHASSYNHVHILVSLLASSGIYVDDNALHNSDHTYSMCLLLQFQ